MQKWQKGGRVISDGSSGGIVPLRPVRGSTRHPFIRGIMSAIEYIRFVRILCRCVEVSLEPGLPAIIRQVYEVSAQSSVEAFFLRSKEVDQATEAFAKENREGLEALKELDGPYRVTRSAVSAIAMKVNLPDTLKAQPTDTDKLNAIEKLLDVLDDHAGEPWADDLLQGEFGTKGAKAVKELNEAIAANKALNKAQMDRAAAYGPAYEKYLRFKRVVRDALGPSSKQYRRIHLRASAGAAEGQDAPPASSDAPAAASSPASDAGGRTS